MKTINSGSKRDTLVTYKISVKTITGAVLTFNNVQQYEFEEQFLKFKDGKSGEVKRFPVLNCEVEEVVKYGL